MSSDIPVSSSSSCCSSSSSSTLPAALDLAMTLRGAKVGQQKRHIPSLLQKAQSDSRLWDGSKDVAPSVRSLVDTVSCNICENESDDLTLECVRGMSCCDETGPHLLFSQSYSDEFFEENENMSYLYQDSNGKIFTQPQRQKNDFQPLVSSSQASLVCESNGKGNETPLTPPPKANNKEDNVPEILLLPSDLNTMQSDVSEAHFDSTSSVDDDRSESPSLVSFPLLDVFHGDGIEKSDNRSQIYSNLQSTVNMTHHSETFCLFQRNENATKCNSMNASQHSPQFGLQKTCSVENGTGLEGRALHLMLISDLDDELNRYQNMLRRNEMNISNEARRSCSVDLMTDGSVRVTDETLVPHCGQETRRFRSSLFKTPTILRGKRMDISSSVYSRYLGKKQLVPSLFQNMNKKLRNVKHAN